MKSFAFFGILSIMALFYSCSNEDKVKKQTDQNYIMGQSKMEVKDYKGAIAAFTRCIALNPNNYDAYHQKALAYKGMDDKKKTLYNYKMAQLIMEKHEDLRDANKKAEYQSLLQEIKDYSTSINAPVTPPAGPNTMPDTSGRD